MQQAVTLQLAGSRRRIGNNTLHAHLPKKKKWNDVRKTTTLSRDEAGDIAALALIQFKNKTYNEAKYKIKEASAFMLCKKSYQMTKRLESESDSTICHYAT